MELDFNIPQCETCKSRFESVFGALNPEQVQDLSLNKGCNFYKKGHIVFHKGSRPTGLYCVNSGKIKVHKTGPDGKDQIVRLVKKGNILGYRAMISGENYSATATVLEAASICFIPRKHFFALLQTNNGFFMRVMELLAGDLRTSEDKMTNLAQKSVRERLAEALLLLEQTYGCEEDEATINVALTRDDLASIVGTATETVIRLLSELKKDKVLSFKGKKITILNHRHLARTAEVWD